MNDQTRAVNRLIAAAVTHREALRSGQGPSRQHEFAAAVDAYVAVRTPVDAARDAFLAQHPSAADFEVAVATSAPRRDAYMQAMVEADVLDTELDNR